MDHRGDWGLLESRPTPPERIYDAFCFLLLMWPAIGGMFLLGSTRVWGYAPGLMVSFLGAGLVLARPLLFARTPSWILPPGFLLWALVVIYVAAGMSWALVPYTARWAALRWANLLAAGLAWTQFGLRRHRWHWLLGVLMAGVAVNCLYGWYQYLHQPELVLWTPRVEQYGLRVGGTYLCPNHLANMIAMMVPMALALLLLPGAGFPLRILAGYYLVVTTPVLYWTESRSGWGGMIGGVAVTLLLLAWRKSRAWLLIALVALPLLGAGAGALAWKTLPVVRQRLGAVIEDPLKASGARQDMWRDVPAMVRAKPLWGHGGGAYLWAYPPYRQHTRLHLRYDYLHNDYLQLLVEHGAAGLGLAALALAVSLWMLIRRSLLAQTNEAGFLLAGAVGALTACLLQAVFDFNFFIFPNPHALIWILGVSVGAWASLEGRIERVSKWGGVVRRVAAGVLLAGCVYGAWVSLSAGMAYYWNLRAEALRTSFDWERVEACYRRAMAWDRLDWRPHLGLGNITSTQAMWCRDPDEVAEKEGRRRLAEAAIAYFEASVARNPGEMEAELGLTRAYNSLGEAVEALRHCRRAADYQPRHVFYQEQLGIQLRLMGRQREALEVFRANIDKDLATSISHASVRSLERALAREKAASAAEHEAGK